MSDVFKPAEAPFVSTDGVCFTVGKKQAETLEVFIQQLVSVRKLFKDRKIVCWSVGGQRAKNGTYCSLCSDSFRCRQRIRIKMLISNLTEEPFPAILEINRISFDSLKQAVEMIGENNLPNKNIIIKNSIVRDGIISLKFIPGI